MQWQWQCVHCVQCVHNVHILQCSGKMQLEESALGCKCIPSYCPLFLIIPLQFIQRFKTNSNFHLDLQWVQKTMINICLWYTYDAHRPSLQWRGTRLQSFVKCNLLNTNKAFSTLFLVDLGPGCQGCKILQPWHTDVLNENGPFPHL